MAEAIAAHVWLNRGLYLALMLALIFTQILPVNLTPEGWPGPDLILAITLAWTLRRPEFVPIPLICAVVFLTDILFQRPPGLWTALVIAGAEFLRRRSAQSRDLPFLAEWAMVAGVMVAITLGNRLVLEIFLVEQTGLWPTAVHLLATVLIYPAVVLLSQLAFGLRKIAPGEVDALGHRL